MAVPELGHIYLIGIGGVGMSAVARLLLGRGNRVSGSELREWPVLAKLTELGAVIHSNHHPSNLDGVDTVIYSTAIPDDHEELAAARGRSLRVMHRSAALAAIMAESETIAVAGSHGKTTTSSLIAYILREADLDPSFVIGGEIARIGSNAHSGSGRHLVAEADESDKSFLTYSPDVAIVTNIGNDHVGSYGDTQSLFDSFLTFARSVSERGFVAVCADDAGSQALGRILHAEQRKIVRYGESPEADISMIDLVSTNQGVTFRLVDGDRTLGPVHVPHPGHHVALNAAGAALVAMRLGVAFDVVARALATFPGVGRRLEHKGTARGVRVYDEYSFHPKSMTAALSTMRTVVDNGSLIVAFQPLRVGRTEAFRSEIAEALSKADRVIVMDVFDPSAVASTAPLAQEILEEVDLESARKAFVPSWAGVVDELARHARAGDVIVTMGAPPIGLMASEILTALEAHGS